MINQVSNSFQTMTTTGKVQSKVENRYYSKTIGLSKDSVSFGGLGAAKLANSDSLKALVKAGRELVGGKYKQVSKVVADAAQEVLNPGSGVSEAAKKFAQKNQTILNTFVKEAGDVAKEGATKLDNAAFQKKAMEMVNAALESYPSVEKGKFLKSKGLHKFLEMANSNQAVFSAAYAILLACILRPITIFSLPAKNKEDNAYSAGHSISSGLIGFAASMLINNPVAKAVKNVKNNPDKYLGKSFDYVKKNAEGQLSGKNMDIATRYMNMIPEIAFAVPKACVTVALVPIILKNVFGLEKGKSKKVAQQPQQPQQAKKDVAFKGASPKKVGFVTDLLSKGVAKVLKSKTAQKIIDKTAASDFNIVKHLSALNGLIISGMYVTRTLNNDKLDPERKQTLAINQASVSVVSTILGYSFDKIANKQIDKFIQRFQAANYGKGAAKLSEYAGGVKAAASMMIFGTVYRYLSPVLVTPIANKLGNMLQERKAAKAQETQNA